MTAERTKEPGAQNEPQRNQLLTMAIRERPGTLSSRIDDAAALELHAVPLNIDMSPSSRL